MKQYWINSPIRWLAVILTALLPAVTALADDDYSEALEQTEEEFHAVRNTVQQSKEEFDGFLQQYKQYEEAVFSEDPDKGIELAQRLFNLDKNQTDAARQKLGQLREMFNTLDKNGIKSKLESASEKLGIADSLMGEVDNVWQFSKKFDPAHAKDNPTYGLRLIGDLLTEGASKMETIPLLGQILGPWVKAYGEVAGDFANALDRLGKKIENFRGGSLCGQHGYKQDQQAAFEKENPGGEDCLTYFAYGGFPRMRGEAYEGNSKYFLFDPSTDRGYFSPLGTTDKVYKWHGLLLKMRALDPDWLASRSNSLKPEVEARAREYYKLFSGWRFKTGEGWEIIDALDLYEDAYFYGRLDEETFVANYIIDKDHNEKIRQIMEEYDKYVFLSGTVFEVAESGKQVAQDVRVEVKLDGSSHSTTTDSDGDWQLLMEGKVGASIEQTYSKDGYEEARRTGRMHKKSITGLLVTLEKEAAEVTITGTVTVKESADATAVSAEGATVSASSAGAASLGSATTGGDGSYSLVVRAVPGVKVELTATKGKATGSTSLTIASEAHSGADIVMTPESDAADTVKWNINATVVDSDGKPLPGATVTGGPAAVTTGADGTAVVGPISVQEMPYSVTLAASIKDEDGSTVGGSSKTVEYQGNSPTAVTLTIGVETAEPVTIFGRVTDVNNVGLGGAVVTSGAATATASGDGSFTLGPIDMFKNSSVEVGASYSDGTNSYAAAPKSVTYDGTSKNLSTVLVIDVETFQDVTITGRVMDLNGEGLAGAAVMCGAVSATTDASGSYSVGPVNVKLGEPVTVSAAMTVEGEAVSGQTTVTPMKATATAPAITLDLIQEVTYQVSITGSVVDGEGNGIGGATVSAGGVSATTGASGSYSLPTFEAVENDVVVISASATDADGNSTAGQASVTVTADAITAPDIALSSAAGEKTTVTISGRVRSSDGRPIMNASVSTAGVSATTSSSGEFTLPAVELEIGKPVTVSASTYNDEGDPVSSSASVTPSGPQASTNITIKLDKPAEDGEGEEDEDIDDLIDDLDDGGGIDVASVLAQYRAAVADLDGLASDFYDDCDHVAQLILEQQEAVCQSSSAGYALSSAQSTLSIYSGTLSGLFGLYADLVAASAEDPSAVNMGSVDASFDRVVDRESAMEGRLNGVRGDYQSYKCDDDAADTDADGYADDDQDADDIEGGINEGGQEICGDDIDNDGDGEIDECSAGCCNKNCQVTVSDCGAAADDVFLVLIDGSRVGVTPKGAANTFNVELSPGTHTVTIKCLDDGGDPPGEDIGTACLTVVVYDTNAGLGGGERRIQYGGSVDISFTVPEGPAQGAPVHFDGSSLRGLEGN